MLAVVVVLLEDRVDKVVVVMVLIPVHRDRDKSIRVVVLVVD